MPIGLVIPAAVLSAVLCGWASIWTAAAASQPAPGSLQVVESAVEFPRLAAAFRVLGRDGLPVTSLEQADIELVFPARAAHPARWDAGSAAAGTPPGRIAWHDPSALCHGRRIESFGAATPDSGRAFGYLALLSVESPGPDGVLGGDPRGLAFASELSACLGSAQPGRWSWRAARSGQASPGDPWVGSWVSEPGESGSAVDRVRRPVSGFPDLTRDARAIDPLLQAGLSEMASMPREGERAILLALPAGERPSEIGEAALRMLEGGGVRVYLLWSGKQKHLKDSALPGAVEATGGRVVNLDGYEPAAPGAARDGRLTGLCEDLSGRAAAWVNGTFRIEFCDDDFDPSMTTREYELRCRAAGTVLTATISGELDPDLLSRLKTADIARAVRWVEGAAEDSLHGAMAAMLARYPLEDLAALTGAAWGRAVSAAAAGNPTQAREVLSALEPLYPGDPQWRLRLREGYARVGDAYEGAGDHAEAIRSYRTAAGFGEIQEIYQSLLKSQLNALDFAGARESADWIYDHGRLDPGELGEFMATLARVQAASQQFRRALATAREGLLDARPGDRAWEQVALLVKGPWFTGAARAVAAGLSGRASPGRFDRLMAEMTKAPDLRWAAVLDPSGSALLATRPADRGRTLWDLSPWAGEALGAASAPAGVAREPLGSIDQPVFLQSPDGAPAEALVLVPLDGEGGYAALAVCYDAHLDWEERDAYAAAQRSPADDAAWAAFDAGVAERIGSLMMKTVGLCASEEVSSVESIAAIASKYAALLPADHRLYEIAVARRPGGAEPAVVHALPAGLAGALAGDALANRTPAYLSREVVFDGERARERGIALYRGHEWLGLLRVGFAR